MNNTLLLQKNRRKGLVALGVVALVIFPIWGLHGISRKIHAFLARPHSQEDASGLKEEEGADKNQKHAASDMTETSAMPVAEASTNAGLWGLVSEKQVVHTNITATLFWVGEEASDDNKHISNAPSAWDDHWLEHFGGVDDPKHRNGFLPESFVPKENPFYVALPYNDFDSKGNRRSDATTIIPWAKERSWKASESMLKNQWVKIQKGNSVAYAQWEDVGPFQENDAAYVFGSAQPKSKTNDHAGIDLSPAVNEYLQLGDIAKVDWQFVSADEVPQGPWKQSVTTSQVDWN